MLRLAPSAPPLWRDDATVQFGADDAARLALTSRWHTVAIEALESGTTRTELRALARLHGATDADADAVIETLASVLVPPPTPPRLSLQVADDLPDAAVRAVRAGLPPSTEVVPWAGALTSPPAPDATVVLLAARRVDPRRAVALVRDDVPHLPLTLDADRAAIGPLVVPGLTACLSCLDATARARDAAWPLVAAQLLGRPRPVIDAGFATEAARAATHLISVPAGRWSRSLHLRADSPRRSWRRHRPSADCHCRSLEGSARGPARSAPAPEPS